MLFKIKNKYYFNKMRSQNIHEFYIDREIRRRYTLV